MIWRTFFCCAVSTYTLSLCDQIYEKGLHNITLSATGTLKFGELKEANVTLVDIHGPIVLGIIGGCLGALFINVNTRMGIFRKKYINTTAKKTIETGMFALTTMSVCVLFIVYSSGC